MLKTPFPYAGNKQRWVKEVWEYLGAEERGVYSEPFLGSAAMLLSAPVVHKKEIVCDTNGFVANFWRALRGDPEQVAYYADWPKVHQDIHARHIWLVKWGAAHAELIHNDCDFYDAKVAGYWAWGQSCWIRAGWCLGEGKEHVSDSRPTSNAYGVSPERKVSGAPPYASGKGEVLENPIAPDGKFDGERLQPWFRALAARLAKVAVLNRSWESAVTKGIVWGGTVPPRIFLDPPYRTDTGRKNSLYNSDFTKESTDIATHVYEWAVAHGEEYAIAYAMHAGDFETPPGWELSEARSFWRKGVVYDPGTSDIIMYSPVAVANKHGSETTQMRLL